MNYKNQFKKSCYIFRYLIFIVTVLLPSTGSAVEYYVSTTGNNANIGTQSAPFGTIKYALGVLKAGDTLFIRGGTYSEKLESHQGTNFPSGNSWSDPVTVTNYEEETVVLEGQMAIGRETPLTQYLIVDGITIDATNRVIGISINGGSNHIRFQNVEVKNAEHFGINTGTHNNDTADDMFNEFINMHVHHNGSVKNVDHGFYISSSGNLIERCDIHDNAAWGIHQFTMSGKPKVNNNIYRNNRVHHNGIVLLSGGGITLSGGANTLAYNNVVWGNLNGILLYNYQDPVNTRVYNNTVYDHEGGGIGIRVVSGNSAPQIINNIVYKNSLNLDFQETSTIHSHNLTTNPFFLDAAGENFHLQSDSPSIDTGTTIAEVTTDFDGNERPQGSFPDIGAFEYLQQTPDDGKPSPPQNLQFTN